MEQKLTELLPKFSERKIIPRSYSEVILTEEETDEALRSARQEKFFRIENEKYWQRVQTPDNPPIMDAVKYFKHIQSLAAEKLKEQGKEPILITTEGRGGAYGELCKYFTEDESCKLDLKKGIMLQGDVGCGKSFILKLCSNNPRKSYHVMDCVKIAAEYGLMDDKKQPMGERMIARFRSELEPKAFDSWKHKSCGAMFDDLGWEEILKHYGNEVSVMERILNGIYSAGLPFSNYHITTNLTASELEDKYGTRITSRLREMFNQIILPGNDLRK